jgi:sterol 3beta-glucosyltransferase
VVAQEAKAVHITILTVGSRGDVQPYLALAAGLRQAGYQVHVATHRPFQAAVHQRGLEFRPVAGNPRELLESDAGLTPRLYTTSSSGAGPATGA